MSAEMRDEECFDKEIEQMGKNSGAEEMLTSICGGRSCGKCKGDYLTKECPIKGATCQIEGITCPMCNGTGYRTSPFTAIKVICHICKGKGVRNTL